MTSRLPLLTLAAAAATLSGLLASYALAITTGVPLLQPHPEPVDGLALATKIHDFQVSPEGLVPNLVAFNVGVELGQVLALAMILIAMSYWRLTPSFGRRAWAANVAIMSAGFVLMGYQLVGFLVYPPSAP